MVATPVPPPLAPPVAPRRPHVVSAHGDDREDPWFWLRERDDPAVLEYLQAENAYTDLRTEGLVGLRESLFEEMKGRIKETDMSVPARRGPWWYYTRTEEGRNYAIHCRRPARGRDELPPAGEPGEEEQILLDENVLAEGSDYFAVGSAAVSRDHNWLAYSTDRAGDEKYELRFRPLEAEISPDLAPETVPETGYGLAWSAATDHVFYVRLDEAHRPYHGRSGGGADRVDAAPRGCRVRRRSSLAGLAGHAGRRRRRRRMVRRPHQRGRAGLSGDGHASRGHRCHLLRLA